MARERKTVDVYEVRGNFGYGHGWEYLCAEFSRYDARLRLNEYRTNSPGSFKIVKKREPKSDYSAEQLADMERQRIEGDKAGRAARLARMTPAGVV
jgi:hypothetical protein